MYLIQSQPIDDHIIPEKETRNNMYDCLQEIFIYRYKIWYIYGTVISSSKDSYLQTILCVSASVVG